MVRAQRIVTTWAEKKVIREIMVIFHNHGVSAAPSIRIYKTCGADVVQVMSENPYRLVGLSVASGSRPRMPSP